MSSSHIGSSGLKTIFAGFNGSPILLWFCVCVCVRALLGGPLSISKELAQMFSLEGLREVTVRKVEGDEVGLDLVELRFKVRSMLSCV